MVENFYSEILVEAFFYIVLLGMSRLNFVEISLQRFVGRCSSEFLLVEPFLMFLWHKFILGDCLVEFFLGRDLSSDFLC